MLYFMGYTDHEGNWTGNFNRAMRNELNKRKIEFVEIPPFDWYTEVPQIDYYNNMTSNDDDVWLFGWAQNPAIDILMNKKGKKYGIVVGTAANPFEPANLWGTSDWLNERCRLGKYDIVFAVSEWCKKLLVKAYPELGGKVVVTGFPIEYEIYDSFKHIAKDPDLIVFNQRLSLEKLHILEVELSHELISMGYRVRHLSGYKREELSKLSPIIAPILNIMDKAGIEYVYNPTKDIYHTNLAKASFAVTTSISDMLPNSMLEAIYMGLIPVAPRNLCFPEFIHDDNLYKPYDIDDIINVIVKKPIREHSILNYSKEKVIDKFLNYMR